METPFESNRTELMVRREKFGNLLAFEIDSGRHLVPTFLLICGDMATDWQSLEPQLSHTGESP